MGNFLDRLTEVLQKDNKVLKEDRRPKVGIWYYIPKISGGWRLWTYSTSDLSKNISHLEAWQVLAEDLAKEFEVVGRVEELKDLPYCYPRGRVDQTDDLINGVNRGKWFILHGGDFPKPMDGEVKKIISEFDLIHQANFGLVEVKEVDHERRDPEHIRLAQEILKGGCLNDQDFIACR